MVKWEFHNDNNIITYTLFLLIQRFRKEDNIYAAQCIWWLASIIQYTEILKYYVDYQVFPSDYVRDCIVTPLLHHDHSGAIVPDSEIPALNLNCDSDIEDQSAEEGLQIDFRINKRNKLNTTRSGQIFKNKLIYKEPTILELEQLFSKQSKKQRRRT